MANAAKFSAQAAFTVVSAIRRGATMSEAAAAAQITRQTLANWLRRGKVESSDEYFTFAAAYRAAERAYRRALIDEIAVRLSSGV